MPKVLAADIEVRQGNFVMLESGLRRPSEIHHDLDQFPETVAVFESRQPFRNVRGENSEKILKVIRHFELKSGPTIGCRGLMCVAAQPSLLIRRRTSRVGGPAAMSLAHHPDHPGPHRYNAIACPSSSLTACQRRPTTDPDAPS